MLQKASPELLIPMAVPRCAWETARFLIQYARAGYGLSWHAGSSLKSGRRIYNKTPEQGEQGGRKNEWFE
jgi:hypothetical protein